ncbi:MAG: CPXCG motif-containing cysteine-rich protein [Halofilum sp. (in: g-proteobacteria)]|nr:CPXCG motif-containing cysteine-rich protein [Halofilum sp. (in: g-proteobacteria)]
MLDERAVECPCCGARFTALVDASEGDCEYIQDCEICCRPLRFTLRTDATGAVELRVRREDDT